MAEKHCNSCGTQTLSRITMSSADWQRNEQRHENREKRLVWIIVLILILFVGSNTFWIIRENSFEDVVTVEETIIDAKQDGTGTNIVGGGDVEYGTNS